MFTICFAVYASLVSTVPSSSVCMRGDAAYASASVAACETLAHDPLTTCEANRVGALKWFITVRQLDTSKVSGN